MSTYSIITAKKTTHPHGQPIITAKKVRKNSSPAQIRHCGKRAVALWEVETLTTRLTRAGKKNTNFLPSGMGGAGVGVGHGRAIFKI